jgi:hypothetical protein
MMPTPTRRVLAFLAGFIAATAWTIASMAAPAAKADDSFQGTWRINYISTSSIDLGLSHHDGHSSWEMSDTVSFDANSFHGLTMDDIKSAKGVKHFQIVRDAGAFDCNGYFAGGIGSGVFDFAPSAAFADALDSRGLGRPDTKDQFELALSNVTLAMVDGLRSAGVTGLSSKALVTLANHDVSAKYVAGLNANGVHASSVDELVRLRDHDVAPEYIAGLAHDGYHPSVDDLVKLRDHDVALDYVAGLAHDGYHPSMDDLVRLRDHDVSLDFISRLQAHGYHPSVDDLIRLRDSGM